MGPSDWQRAKAGRDGRKPANDADGHRHILTAPRGGYPMQAGVTEDTE